MPSSSASRCLASVKQRSASAWRPGPVQRGHAQRPQPFPQRMLPAQGLQLAGHLGVAAQGQVGLEAGLDGRQPQLLQPGSLPHGELAGGELGQRLAPQQGERPAQGLRRRRGVTFGQRGPVPRPRAARSARRRRRRRPGRSRRRSWPRRSDPRVRRSWAICVRSAFSGLAGRSSPQTPAMRRSAPTGAPRCSASNASSARNFAPRTGSGASPSHTSSSPSRRISTGRTVSPDPRRGRLGPPPRPVGPCPIRWWPTGPRGCCA